MSSTQFWVGMLVPPIVKWANRYLKHFFKLTEFDAQTKARITAKSYPFYYSFLYGLWMLSLVSTGFIALIWFVLFGHALFPDKNYAVPVFLGIINMVGIWFIAGAILDFFFWKASAGNFRDYVMFRQIKSGWGYDMKQQIQVLFKLGLIYYIVAIPVMLILWLFA